MKLRPAAMWSIAIAVSPLVGNTAVQAQSGTVLESAGASFSVIGPVSTYQGDATNVFGLVQTGADPVATIAQSGSYNRAVVVQFGPDAAVNTIQRGFFNRVHVLQVGTGLTASVLQDGAVNTATIDQATTADARIATMRFVQNLLFAPETVAAQAEVGQVAGRSFGDRLFAYLDVGRLACPGGPVNAAFAADLPQGQAAPAPAATYVCPPLSLFATGAYGRGEQDERLGATGYKYALTAANLGTMYRVSPNLRLGSIFEYNRIDASLTYGFGKTDLDSYQFSLFGSVSYPNWFLDAATSFGVQNFNVERPGFDTPVTASPDGSTFLARIKTGYLLDLGLLQVGPIGGLSYLRNWVDGYSEQGDPLLVQRVPERDLRSLTGSAGVQVRIPLFAASAGISPFVNVTWEREFLDSERVLSTRFALFPGTAIQTPLQELDRTYGKVAAGFNIDLGQSLSATFVGESTFARSGGEEFTLSAGLRLHY